MSTLRGTLTVLLTLAVLALPAAVSPAGADAAGWQRAELWGADVRSLVFHPQDPDRVWAGTSGGHLYVSRDGGESWTDAGSPLALRGWVVSDLEVDPDDPGRLWAGLWGTHGGGLVVASDDGGASWEVPGRGLYDTKVYTLARVPGRPGHLYAGTLSGVHFSADGGVTWRHLTTQLPEVHKVTSLLVGPEDPERVFAGTWERAWRSDDGGATWTGVFDGMILDSEVFTLTPVPGRPDEIWAATCGWVYRTLDAGGRWQRFRDGFENRRTPAFAALPGGRLLAGTVGGLHLSDDGGAHWRRVGPEGLSVLSLAYHPQRPRRVLVGTEGSGVWLSEDGGATLRRAARGMRNLRVAALVKAGGEVLAAVNHAGPASGVHASKDGGRTFAADPAPLPAVRDLAVYGVGVYAATERGLWERSAGDWRQITEVGGARVDQVVAGGNRLVARTADALWELAGPRFEKLPYHHGLPRSAAPAAAALWVSDAAGLYRLAAETNDAVDVPFRPGRVTRFGDRLLWWGDGGAHVRPDAASPWVRLTAEPTRLLTTGSFPHPALLVSDEADTAHLLDITSGTLLPVEDLPVPAEEILSVLLDGDRLLVGTAGHGLYIGPVPQLSDER